MSEEQAFDKGKDTATVGLGMTGTGATGAKFAVEIAAGSALTASQVGGISTGLIYAGVALTGVGTAVMLGAGGFMLWKALTE